MPGPAVVNASPLILLGKIDRLRLLRALGRDLIVPDVVVEELNAKGADDAVVQAVGRADWLRTVAVPPIQESVAAWRLGMGETAVIACALQYENPVTVLDDREGRRCAASHGLAVVGTIGVVLLAKDDGLISLVAPVLNELVTAGMRVSDELFARALHLAGEPGEESQA